MKPYGEEEVNSTASHILILALAEIIGQLHALAALTPEEIASSNHRI
jgi:hypothetical protein